MTELPPRFVLGVVAVLGAIVGSFLNVCIYRLPLRQSIVWPASACTACSRPLEWYENVPILSYAILRGRCRTCRTPFTIRYPIVEALTAAMFALAWWYYGPGLLFISRIVFGCALVVLFAIDLEHQLLPHAVTLPAIAVGFAFSFFTEPGWRASLVGIVAGFGILMAVFYGYLWARHIEALGMGDPKMLAMIGAFLGWQMMLVSLFAASFIGSLVGLLLIATRRGTMASKVPFGCFLALGGALAASVGPNLVHWYLGNL